MVRLQKVGKEEETILHNLMQLYIYEFSKFIPDISLEQNGTYMPFALDKYWELPNYHPYFIKLDDELIGFALIKSATGSTPNTINEFFIIQKYNGKGYGKKAAIMLFDMYPGKWRITQIQKNYPAQAFWRGVITKFTNNNYTESYDEDRRSVQEFDSFSNRQGSKNTF